MRATGRHAKADPPKTAYDWIKKAHDHGARFWACPANLELFNVKETDPIPECHSTEDRSEDTSAGPGL